MLQSSLLSLKRPALLFVDKLLAKANGDASWWEVVVSGFWALLDVGAGLKAVSKIANAKSAARLIAKDAFQRGVGGSRVGISDL